MSVGTSGSIEWLLYIPCDSNRWRIAPKIQVSCVESPFVPTTMLFDFLDQAYLSCQEERFGRLMQYDWNIGTVTPVRF